MRVRVYFTNDMVHNRVLAAFAKGCPEPVERIPVTDYEPSDVAVVFGVEKRAVAFSKFRGNVIEQQHRRGLKVVVLETGYVNRGDGPEHHYAAGLGGMNGWADFRNVGMPSDRWEKLKIPLAQPKSNGNHIILCAQVPWDANVQDIDMLAWLAKTVTELRARTDRRILYRPHPKAIARLPGGLVGCDTSISPLKKDLAEASALVAWNSNSLVEAAIAGVATIALGPGGMADAVSHTSLDFIDAGPREADRQQWANDLAYSQWNLWEMDHGLAWRHLFGEV